MKRKWFGIPVTLAAALALALVPAGCDNGSTTVTQYTVTFDAQGGQVSPYVVTVEEGKTLTSLPAPTKTSGDTVFQGWYTKNGANSDWGFPFNVLTPIVADITVYAKWGNAAPVTYTVTFNADGGTVSPASIQVNSGDPAGSLPVPTKSGNTFDGWWTAQNGSGTAFTETSVVTANITVYAKWTVTGGTNNLAGLWTRNDPNLVENEVLKIESDNTWEVAWEESGEFTGILKGTYVRSGNSAKMTVTHYFEDPDWIPMEQYSGEEFPSELLTPTVTVSGNTLTATNLGEPGAKTFSRESGDSAKQVSITGLSEYADNKLQVLLLKDNSFQKNGDILAGFADDDMELSLGGGTVEVPLRLVSEGEGGKVVWGQPWTGSGSYYVVITLLGGANEGGFKSKDKIAFTSTVTTIQFSTDSFDPIEDPGKAP